MDLDVSIVICTHNRAHLLPAVIDALGKCRSGRHWEVVLVDNASTDDTAQIIQTLNDLGGRLRSFHCARPGSGAARDFGWRQARGRIITFTDDDCYVAPDFVDAVIQAFEDRPEGCLGGRILMLGAGENSTDVDGRETAMTIAERTFVPAGELHSANLSFRREVLEAIGGFDPDLGAGTPFPCEDVDAVARSVWGGFSAGFDARPVVFHDGATSAKTYYDGGRGAYYAKYILRRDTRWTYLWGWIRSALQIRGRSHVARLYREMKSARAYLRLRRRAADPGT